MEYSLIAQLHMLTDQRDHYEQDHPSAKPETIKEEVKRLTDRILSVKKALEFNKKAKYLSN